jgi:hypothetical protein
MKYLTIILLLAIPHLAHAGTELTADESIPIPKIQIDAKGNLQITASPTSSASDFDFLVGKWKLHNRHLNKRLENYFPTSSSNPLRLRGAAGAEGAELSQWTEFDSSSENSKVLAGTADMDIYSTTHFPGQDGKLFEGLTLRLFDPKTRLWSLYWSASNTGTIEPPQAGSFENGVGHFFAKDTFKGKPIIVVFRWDARNKERPLWGQAFSADEGKTWEWNFFCVFEKPNE